MSEMHRHDLSDEAWARLWPMVLQAKGKRGRRAEDGRLFFDATLWKLRTATPWRDLPPAYGDWQAVALRFHRWRNAGVWQGLLDVVSGEPDLEWLMIDASPIKAHPHAAGAKGGRRPLSAPRDGLNTRPHPAVDGHGLPVRMIVAGGNMADCTQAEDLIDGLVADHLMADKAYDTNHLLDWCHDHGTRPVIPPGRNRKDRREDDQHLHKLRHLVEDAFLKLEQWRSVATRHARTTAPFLAECQIAAIMLGNA